MDLSRLVTSNTNGNYYTTECTIRARTSSNPDKTQPRVMPCNMIPSISIPKDAYQDNSSSSYNYLRINQPPLSPPEEGQVKFTLPSISTLLQGVDGISRDSEAKRRRSNPPTENGWDRRSRSDSSSQAIRDGPALPPTPPLRPGSGFQELRHSPTASSASSRSIIPHPSPTAASSPSASEDSRQRRFSTASVSQHSNRSSFSYLSQPESPYQSNMSPLVPFAAAPAQPPISTPEYRHHHQPSGIYAPPVQMHMPPLHHHPQIVPGMPPAGAAAAWQHHHYFPPSGAAPYPLTQDRYICRTCHKAFSRPSSLRIHSHSHTGEKPFRCPHVGCGKAFSVRSNMKRHERGCHTGRAANSSTLVS